MQALPRHLVQYPWVREPTNLMTTILGLNFRIARHHVRVNTYIQLGTSTLKLGSVDFHEMFHCLGYSAWEGGNYAELAGQLDNVEENLKSMSTQLKSNVSHCI